MAMLEELKNMTFANEAEEAAWWESHEDDLADEFEKATAEGRVGIGTVAKRAALPSTTIRLDPDDIAKARVQAAARGLRYQTYLKMIIHEALRNVESGNKFTQHLEGLRSAKA
jgi:predicted DNA binding CopG/RHH family protein